MSVLEYYMFQYRTANYELLIMMPSDNYYMNQDGVVHHDYLPKLCLRVEWHVYFE